HHAGRIAGAVTLGREVDHRGQRQPRLYRTPALSQGSRPHQALLGNDIEEARLDMGFEVSVSLPHPCFETASGTQIKLDDLALDWTWYPTTAPDARARSTPSRPCPVQR